MKLELRTITFHVTSYTLHIFATFILGITNRISSYSQMQPSMLLKLLRKLTVDVSKLSEYTTVALRVRQLLLFFSSCFYLIQILKTNNRSKILLSKIILIVYFIIGRFIFCY